MSLGGHAACPRPSNRPHSMFASPGTASLIILLVALSPGAVSFCLGQRLVRRIADPAFPELLAAHRRQTGAMFGIGMGLVFWLVTTSFDRVFIAIVGAFFICYGAILAAAYPLRRALYQETWSLPTYLSFYPRTFFGVFGFWFTLAGLPAIAAFAGDLDWLVALPLAGVIVVWNRRYADVVRWALRTEPIAEGELLGSCRALAEKCMLPHVRFEFIPLSGGVIANALALPSLRGPSVLFTETLLERFDRQEILAVAAHELAHFDHYNPTYLRRLNLGTYLLIAAGVAIGPASRAVGTEWGLVPGLLWFFLVFGFLALRARGKQRQETACDLKAVELTGNAEAVISGLTKLHTIARLPRRLDNRTEQAATHPSLARRIRDIRKAAGFQSASLPERHTFISADGRSTVIFDVDDVQWIDHDGVRYTLSYSHLTELRVEVKAGRPTRLVAVGPSARRWELVLSADDVAPIQAVLDTIDGRLADPPAARVGLAFGPQIKRIVLIATITIVLSMSQLGMALIALVAWAKPTPPILVGAGLAALTTAAFMLRDLSGYLSEFWIPLTILALFFFGLAWSARGEPRHGTGKYLAALAVAATLCIAVILLGGFTFVDLHRSARDLPSATVFLVALAGALVLSKERRERLAGLVAAVLAVSITSVGSTAFLDRFGADPFLVPSHPLRSVSLNTRPIAVFDVPSDTSRIGLSSDARYVAVYTERDEDRDARGKVQIGRVGNPLTPITADDVSFVGDDELLVVHSTGDSTVLKAQTLNDSSTVVWQHVVDDMLEPTLSVNQITRRWALLGWNGEDTVVRVEGGLDGSAIEKTQWSMAQDEDDYVSAMASSGPDALFFATRYEASPVARALPWRWTWARLMVPSRPISHYTSIAKDRRRTSPDSRLDTTCIANVVPGGLGCTAYDGSRTHIVTISPGFDHVQCVGYLEGQFITNRSGVQGWLTGWIVGRAAAIHVSTGEVLHAVPPMRTLRLVPVSGDRVAALTFAANRVQASVYALTRPGEPMASSPLAQRRTNTSLR